MLTEINRRQIHYSFRIESDSYKLLESESKKKRVSINTLLNQIVDEHYDKKNFEKLGSLLMSKDVVQCVFECAEEQSLTEHANQLGTVNAVEYLNLLYHNTEKSSAIRFLDTWFSTFASYEHIIDGAKHFFSLSHGVNEKYSIFTKEFVKSFAGSILHEPVKIMTTPRTITFSINVP